MCYAYRVLERQRVKEIEDKLHGLTLNSDGVLQCKEYHHGYCAPIKRKKVEDNKSVEMESSKESEEIEVKKKRLTHDEKYPEGLRYDSMVFVDYTHFVISFNGMSKNDTKDRIKRYIEYNENNKRYEFISDEEEIFTDDYVKDHVLEFLIDTYASCC